MSSLPAKPGSGKLLPTIGVIGASGATGIVVSRILAASGTCELHLAGRSAARLAPLAHQLGAHAATLDVIDDHALRSFCSSCRIIVNCAGPWSRLGPRVPLAAAAAGCHLVDASGDPSLFDRLAPVHAQAIARGQVLLVGAGYVPGLSAILLRHVAAHARERSAALRGLSVYVIDRNDWSSVGFEDLAQGLCIAPAPIGVYRAGDWQRVSILAAWRTMMLPNGFGRARVLPIRSDELAELSRAAPAATVAMYLPLDVRTLLAARTIGALFGRRPARAAAILKWLVRQDAARRGGGGLLAAVAEAEDGERFTHVLRVAQGRHYEVTGIAVALAALLLARAEAVPAGRQHVADAVQPDVFLRELEAYGFPIDEVHAEMT